jgi:hypothetical protein
MEEEGLTRVQLAMECHKAGHEQGEKYYKRKLIEALEQWLNDCPFLSKSMVIDFIKSWEPK